ncbi:subtilisin-like protein [Colletotrichum zoysiae]|uniref:Subtilisin-like protein n=1 Tax=Colletotrichum zoysiae TaxID=1216348 RepID=A0AAD9M2N7_9PEZI|nr:subtilisin-like protein [Colletotrichum zoysiae]
MWCRVLYGYNNATGKLAYDIIGSRQNSHFPLSYSVSPQSHWNLPCDMLLYALLWAVALSAVEAKTWSGFGRGHHENTFLETRKFVVEAEPGVTLDALSRKIEATGCKILKSFNSAIFKGFSVESSPDNIDILRNVAEVSKTWPSKIYRLAPVVSHASFSDDATAKNWSIHFSTGVDQLHEAGILGKGVKVAIIDSGVDYRHPALGGGFGLGYTVSGGYDLVGEEYDGSNEKIPDGDPLDSLGHGTHVAGIIAGKSEL